MLINILGIFLLIKDFGHLGIALSLSLSSWINAIILLGTSPTHASEYSLFYPSAYANLAASKYCKDPNYAKKSKGGKRKGR